MNETELEQLAINELLIEAESQPLSTSRSEQKINKLVMPNKKFLSSTLTAAISHNKREEERTRKNCRKKLKKIENRRTARMHRKDNHHKHTGKSHESTVSSSDTEQEMIIPNEIQYPRKHTMEEHTKEISKKRKTNTAASKRESEATKSQYEQEEYYAKYFSELAAFALASESYNQVGKWLCYQALLAGSSESYEQDYNVPYEYLTQHGIEVLEPLDPIKENTISLSSDDEIKEELNLDDDPYLLAPASPIVKFEPVQLDEYCISLDSDEEDQNDSKSASLGLVKEELNNFEEEVGMQTIDISDSSDNEDTETRQDVDGSIDLTSD